jgi:hypothetical protein
MEATALGLGGCLTAPLTPDERTAIRTALGLAGSEYPIVVFSAGGHVSAIAEASPPDHERLEAAFAGGGGARLTYQLAEPGPVRLVIYDLAGRPVRSWGGVQQSAGVHSVEWDGSNDNGRSLPAGSYFCRLTITRVKPVQLTARITLTR